MFERLERIGIVPVVKIKDANDAVPLARALYNGGIDVIEVTFRTDAAADAIKRIIAECPDMYVGAGTVVGKATLNKAVECGAKFLVSPGLDSNNIRAAKDLGIPILPGVVTPSEIEQGIALGIDVFKFFPSEAFGGMSTIKALYAPYSGIRFVPTGGINENNAASYLKDSRVLAVGGSWLAPQELVLKGDYDAISSLAKKAVELVRAARASSGI